MKLNREPRNRPHKCNQLIFEKERQFSVQRIVFSTNGTGKIGYAHVKKNLDIDILQKLTHYASKT